MKIGDEVIYKGRIFRVVVEEFVGDAWLPASSRDVDEPVMQALLASLPVCDLAWKMVAQSGQKGGA